MAEAEFRILVFWRFRVYVGFKVLEIVSFWEGSRVGWPNGYCLMDERVLRILTTIQEGL